MLLYCSSDDPRYQPTEEELDHFQGALETGLREEGIQGDPEISLSFVGKDRIRALNRQYRSVDAVTDVLSFPLEEGEAVRQLDREGKLRALGDIVICLDRVEEQAEEYGHSMEREMTYLMIHSLLHLLGYDHMEEGEKRVMRIHEEAIMEKLGLPQEGEAAGGGKTFHSGFCAVIGRSNVGKSSLLNWLMGEKLSIVSSKPQTTRHQIQLIYTDDRMQAVFLDTPGVQIPQNELGEAMLKVSENALKGVDLCLFMVDSSLEGGRLDRLIMERLRKIPPIPIILVVNKVDKISPRMEEGLLARYRDMGLFTAVVPLSVKKERNKEGLLDAIYQALPEGPLYYPEEMITNRSERFIISELIREKCLENISEEVPHGIFVDLTDMHYREDKPICDIQATIYVERESQKGIVIGREGRMLKTIGSQARQEIQDFLDYKVNLKLWVKVAKNWTRQKNRVKQFGFEEK